MMQLAFSLLKEHCHLTHPIEQNEKSASQLAQALMKGDALALETRCLYCQE